MNKILQELIKFKVHWKIRNFLRGSFGRIALFTPVIFVNCKVALEKTGIKFGLLQCLLGDWSLLNRSCNRRRFRLKVTFKKSILLEIK